MDPVHERGSMDPVHILIDPVHGPGPRRGSMDQGSMFCTFPIRDDCMLNWPFMAMGSQIIAAGEVFRHHITLPCESHIP